MLGVSEAFEIRTARLRLRSWRDEDFEPYAAMNADARVMEFYPSVISREESRVAFRAARARIAERGYSFWPVEVIGGAPFIGMVGLSNPDFQAPFCPRSRSAGGWRPSTGARVRDRGGAGRARLRLRAAGLPEIVAFTTVGQRPLPPGHGEARHAALARRRFPAPAGPEGHPLRPHVLYRLRREDFAPAA